VKFVSDIINGKRVEHTVSCEKGNGSTICTGTTSTTNTMDIILRVVRVVIIQHVSNVANIFIDGLARARKVYSNVPGRLVKELLHLNASNTLAASDMNCPLRV
jgi:hypothetical protein